MFYLLLITWETLRTQNFTKLIIYILSRSLSLQIFIISHNFNDLSLYSMREDVNTRRYYIESIKYSNIPPTKFNSKYVCSPLCKFEIFSRNIFPNIETKINAQFSIRKCSFPQRFWLLKFMKFMR